MSSARWQLPERPAEGIRGEDLKPRSPAEILDAAYLLLREHPALLLPLGSLHVLPLAAALAALLTLPGRAFPVEHPSGGLFLIALAGALALMLRPLGLWATTLAVQAIAHGETPEAGPLLRRAIAARGQVANAAARCLAIDALTLGLGRLLGWHHTAVPLVAADGLDPAAARRESRQLASAFSSAHLKLNLLHLMLLLSLYIDLGLGVTIGLFLAKSFLGLELTRVVAFVSMKNFAYLLLLLYLTFAALEPLRAVAKALLLLDLRLREEGRDLLIRLARLG